MREALKAACDAVPDELQGLLHADEIRGIVEAFLKTVPTDVTVGEVLRHI